MNIEVGDYVRSADGFIGKVIKIEYDKDFNDYALYIDHLPSFEYATYVQKWSKKIIDLISSGDYVNGKYVFKNGVDFDGEKCLHLESSDVYACQNFLYEKDIKSIVTHQQFKQMEYEVNG